MKMIRRAVDQRPDDGYIVDSLGWAYYRIGNYEEATKHAGTRDRPQAGRSDHQRPSRRRLLEASAARWKRASSGAHARDLKPDPEELPKIEAKIRDGLPDDKAPAAASADGKKDDKGG
jgi:hypothetical protein